MGFWLNTNYYLGFVPSFVCKWRQRREEDPDPVSVVPDVSGDVFQG